MTSDERQFLIETLCEDLVPMIMEEYNLSDKEAIDKLYKSNTFSKIEDPDTGLYYQSPVYVFDESDGEVRQKFPDGIGDMQFVCVHCSGSDGRG